MASHGQDGCTPQDRSTADRLVLRTLALPQVPAEVAEGVTEPTLAAEAAEGLRSSASRRPRLRTMARLPPLAATEVRPSPVASERRVAEEADVVV
jgi:hypothetical protein